MAHAVVNVKDVEALGGRFRALTAPLQAEGLAINRLELQPGEAAPDHNHREDEEEEVYVVISGSGTLRVDEEEIAVGADDFVRCSPEAQRQMIAGEDGLVWIGIGVRKPAARA
jgi:quercetin dioxygenase-like cupin family protein